MVESQAEQLTLELAFQLGESVPLDSLQAGDRFLRDSGTEGQLIGVTQGSATVKVLRETGRWETTRWSRSTPVRRMKV